MRRLTGLFFLAALLGASGCDPVGETNTNAAPAPAETKAAAKPSTPVAAPTYGYEVVNTFPHDPRAFTQGLVFHDGALIESTGQYGESTLRRVELKTGKVLKKVDVRPDVFAEGITLFGGKIYQLSWQNQKGFVYDPATFEKVGEFRYDGEGWGLTDDGESLILSDGTYQLRFLDPNNFNVRRTVSVHDGGRPLMDINELEYVRGEIYANVWHQGRVARIDPQSGRVLGWIDLSGLIAAGEVGNNTEAVLNGIAYDEAGDRLFVTGKLWPKLFEIRVTPK